MPLLSIGNDAKTVKGEKLGVRTAILYLAPHTIAGRGNVCASASEACRAACLYTAGKARYANVQAARINRTRAFFDNAAAFVDALAVEIAAHEAASTRAGMVPAVRLNGTSDIPWERVKGTDGLTLFERFPSVQFYDYTKHTGRYNLPPNYSLTYSYAEGRSREALAALIAGRNVAVVFDAKAGRPDWVTFLAGTADAVEVPVIDGDESDVRFMDARGVVVGLKAKGAARSQASGFVIVGDEIYA
jgi:hypothetical protein